VRERVRTADYVVHAGDFDSAGVLATVEDLAPALTAVTGNMDPALDLPGVATVELCGVEFVVTHGTGSPTGYEERVARTVRDHASGGPTVGVAGHTHEVLDTTVGDVRLLILSDRIFASHSSRKPRLSTIFRPRRPSLVHVLLSGSMNPGSATGARPAREASMLTATVTDGDLDVTVHRE
jgi:predicted phosphodiesterase